MTEGSDALRQILHGLPGVDQVGVTERAAALATRSIKRDAKLWALDAAVRMIDLTTLEGADTPGKVRGLCAKARQPDPADPAVPPVAAVCVYPDLVTVARSALDGSALGGSALDGNALEGSALEGSALEGSALEGSALGGSALGGSALGGSALGGSALGGNALGGNALDGRALAGPRVLVASVATAFPSGRASLAVKLADVADAVAAGADEVDMVIDRGAFLAGRYGQVSEEIRAVREACGAAHLKVILETGELVTLDNVARASWLAMLSGADFIKTSTGKVSPAATPQVALVMLAAVRAFADATGQRVGVKVAGGVRTAKDAIRYLVLVRETAGVEWLSPALFRIGASSLLNDLLMQRSKQLTGVYAGADYFTMD